MFALSDTLQRRFAALKSTADFWSLRHVQESRESYWYAGVWRRRRPSSTMPAPCSPCVSPVSKPMRLSQGGLQAALERAELMARALVGHNLLDLASLSYPTEQSDDVMPGYQQQLAGAAHWFELLMAESALISIWSRVTRPRPS